MGPMSNATTTKPTVDTILRQAREKRVRDNRWEASVVHNGVVVSVDGDGTYDVGTAARSHARGPRRVVAPVLEQLLLASSPARSACNLDAG